MYIYRIKEERKEKGEKDSVYMCVFFTSTYEKIWGRDND